MNKISATRGDDSFPSVRMFSSALVCVCAALLGACSVLVDANRVQCSENAECTKRGPAFADSVCSAGVCEAPPLSKQWNCPALPTNQTPSYKLTLHLTDAVSVKPLPGVDASLCRKLDINCDNPVTVGVSDAKGDVTMQVDAAFDGYVMLIGSMLVSELYTFSAPMSGNLDARASLLTSKAAAGLAQAAGGAWLADRGLVLLDTTDCEGKAVANVSYSVTGPKDASSYVFYTVTNFPTNDATATDESGYGGVVNLLPGVATIAATLASGTANERAVGNVSLNVRAGFITYGTVTPASL